MKNKDIELVKNIIIEVMNEKISINSLKPEIDLICDLKFDSFIFIETVVLIEEQFQIDLKIENLDFTKHSKLSEFLEYIDQHMCK